MKHEYTRWAVRLPDGTLEGGFNQHGSVMLFGTPDEMHRFLASFRIAPSQYTPVRVRVTVEEIPEVPDGK